MGLRFGKFFWGSCYAKSCLELKIRVKKSLKVSSHQIRLAWKWYGWKGLDEYENGGWFNEFFVVSIFIFWFYFSERYIAKHDPYCMQFADSARKGIQRVTYKLLQQLIIISASLLQAAGRYQIAACNTFLFSRIFWFCMRYLTPFGFLPKGGRLPLELKQKGIQ